MPDSTLWKKKKKVQHFKNNRPYKCFNWLALQKNYNLPTLSSNFGHPKQQSKHIQFIYDHWTHGTWIRRYTVSPSPSSPPTKKKKHKTEKKNQHTTVFTKCLWTCDSTSSLLQYSAVLMHVLLRIISLYLVMTRIHTRKTQQTWADAQFSHIQNRNKYLTMLSFLLSLSCDGEKGQGHKMAMNV